MRMISVLSVLLVVPVLGIPYASADAMPPPAAACARAPDMSERTPAVSQPFAPAGYATGDAAARGDFAAFVPERSDAPATAWAGDEAASASSGKRDYVPLLLSVLVPGAGELYMGYTWRGIALVSVEVAAWTGYLHYHDQGMDSRASYETYADAHWDTQKWVNDHDYVYPQTGWTIEELEAAGRAASGSGDWPGYTPWVSKEEDKQHYYENIGKYDWFISGWSDYDPTADPLMHDTAVRDQYRAMRRESNDQLDRADTFIYVSIGARVFSIVETILLTRPMREDRQGEGANEGRLSLRARPRGFSGGEIALEYRFR